MKKTLIITWAVVLALANIGGCVWAAEGPWISLDFLYGNDFIATDESGSSSGSTYTRNIDETYVLSGLLIGVVYPWQAFNFGLEYGAGQTEDYAGAKTDFNLSRLVAGYRLWDGEQFKLIPYLGWLSLKAGDSQYGGAELGIDLQLDISAQVRLAAGAGYAPKATLQYGSDTCSDTGLWDYRVRAEYAMTDRFCLGLGYQAYHYSGKYSSSTDSSNYSNGSLDGISDFLTLGLVYRLPAPEERVAAGAETPDKVEEQPKETSVQSEPAEQPAEPKPAETAAATQPEQPTPEPAVEPQPAEPVRFLIPIFFDFDSAMIRADQQGALEQDVQILQTVKGYILIGGHADPFGEREYNIGLSRRRAQAVADYLIAHGIDPARIVIFAYGKDHPEAKRKAEGWPSDRWADIVITVEEPRMEMGIRK